LCYHSGENAWFLVRAGKNLRFFRKKLRFLGFLGFLGFNVRTVARGTLDTGIR